MLKEPVWINDIRWLQFANDSGEDIPAFALVRISAAGTDGILIGDKPNSDGQDVYLNGPTVVADGDNGLCSRDLPGFALYDTGDGTPVAGSTWGARSGEWKLRLGESGFFIVGGAVDGRVLVASPFAATAAGGSIDAVTNVCPIFSTISGTRYQIGETVEYTTIALPAGSTVGSPTCEDDPEDCCDASTGNDCGDCLSMPAQWTVEFADVVDGSCSDCEAFNITHTLTYDTDCTWRSEIFIVCGGDYTLILFNSSGSWYLQIDPDLGGTENAIYVCDDDDFNCNAKNVMLPTGVPVAHCGSFPTHVTIKPV